MKHLFIALSGVLIALFANAQADEFEHLQSLNNPAYHLVESETLERSFHIYVRLPDNYDASERDYPTIYLLDGGITFPLLAGYFKYLSLGREVPDAVIVGIAYGSDNFETGNLRGTDFTAAAPDRDHYGGAPRFQNFLKSELLPFIEKDYRSDPTRRIIFGQSLGGQFVLYSALTKPELFWGHIASNPALHRNLPFFLENHSSLKSSSSRVFVSSGSNDNERFRTPALAWINHWSTQSELPWALKTVTLVGETHFSAAPAAFRTGMRWLFETEPPETE